MTSLVLSLGSNIERDKHIRFALKRLSDVFGALIISPVYETIAVGFDGPDFYNLVVLVQTKLPIEPIIEHIQLIEAAAGRVRGQKCCESRSLDIDVLLFGDADLRALGRNIPRDEIVSAAYVLKPLADILPDMRHPVIGQSFSEMWAERRDKAQGLHKIEFAA